jgi:diguanylate cyclase (GGDEF)-like protein
MKNSTASTQSHERIHNEVIQSYLRICLISLTLLVFLLQNFFGTPVNNPQAYILILGYLIWVLVYLGWIKIRPQLFATQRVMFIMLCDIMGTAFAMYLTGELSSLFVAVFLWYIIGYGMRFGLEYAVVATGVTVVSWLLLMFFSSYWSAHLYQSFGWLLAIVIIPTYYFVLVKRLHASLRKLNISLAKTEKIASQDNLTGLANRNHFNILTENLLQQERSFAIFLLDLDNFKGVNDKYGHNAGDQLLMDIAKTLKDCCGANCIVGRLGGDEFIIASTETTQNKVCELADRILKNVAEVSSEHGQITASIGVCLCPDDAQDMSLAKSCADAAMYLAKKQGKNRYCFYSNMPKPFRKWDKNRPQSIVV